ncbi:type II toxin-antitoxin system RelE/ParE family toxin [Mycobacterium sp. pUA109]|uniref:type II toxin-antitoxin system RelE/ParE family toxin n=1 Tax=Mycobacterium sp. pUA109 TaxID=3238982 RepID=UPI00351BC45C
MSKRCLLSPAAQTDLGQIWDYTNDRWGVDQAEEYLRELQHAIERTAANPRIGQTDFRQFAIPKSYGRIVYAPS